MAAESPHSAPRRPAAAVADAKNGAAGLLSPRFRSVAELAGWDEESILLAALVVEDTPVRESRRKRRPSSASATGGSAGSNTRKRRSWRQSPAAIPMPPVTLVLSDDDDGGKPNNPADYNKEMKEEEQSKVSAAEGKETSGSAKEAVTTGKLPCLDQLREELSCAICLDICFEPSTTPCGHSFCMQCLKRAASKCGKRCPKCRQLISNSRSCTINTVLWNTIQLLFPSEVEARRTSIASCSASMDDDVKQTVPRSNSFTQGGMRSRNTSTSFVVQDSTRVSNTNRSFVTPGSRRSMQSTGSMNTSSGSLDTRGRSTRSRNSSRSFVQASQLVATRGSGQSDDSALAYRLQQEEFMTAFDTEDGERQPQNAVSIARANLRPMASRAVRLRARGWPIPESSSGRL